MTRAELSKWWRTEPSWVGFAIVMVTGVLIIKLGFVIGLVIGVVLAGAMQAVRALRLRG